MQNQLPTTNRPPPTANRLRLPPTPTPTAYRLPLTANSTSLKLVLLVLVALVVTLPAVPVQAQSPAPDRLIPGVAPPGPPVFAPLAAETPKGPGVASALVCSQASADPQVQQPAAKTPWRELRAARAISGDHAFSPPQSIQLSEDADGEPASGDDIDTVGQTIGIAPTAQLLYGSLRYRVQAGSAAAGERLVVELYRVNQLSPSGRLASFPLNTAAAQGDRWLSLDWELADATVMATLRAQGQATLAVTLESRGGGAQQVWIDEIVAHVCTPAATIAGQITQRNVAQPDLSDAQILLTRSDSAGTQTVAATRPDAGGSYSFSGVPALPAGARYQVWFLNAPPGVARANGRLSFWAGPSVAQLAAGQQVSLAAFDVSDVRLLSPASQTEVAATVAHPAHLSWGTRDVPGERFQLCLYDPQRASPEGATPVQACGPLIDPRRGLTVFNLTPESFADVPGFDFQFGRGYRWYVVVSTPGMGGQPDQYGYSFFEHAITLVAATTSAPRVPVTDAPGLPAAPAGTADWTLMVYAAGDNALGDRRRAPGAARLDVQLGALARLAAAHPRVHIVTYSDLYGDTGAQLCYLRPAGGPDCRARAEPNSADPATLRDFVALALARYPARRALLVLAGPGHALGGFGPDETTPGTPAIGVTDLGAALRQASTTAQRPLDIVLLQAPLMGALSTAVALAPGARYAVAASDQIWQIGLYGGLLPLLSGASRADPAAVTRGIVGVYDAAVIAARPGLARSLAAYDLSRATAASTALDQLGAALAEQLATDQAATIALLEAARQGGQRYDSSANGLLGALERPGGTLAADEDALVDALTLADSLATAPAASAQVQAAALGLRTSLGGATPLVLAASQHAGTSITGRSIDLSRASGLALFLPGPTRAGDQATMAQLALYRSGSGWPAQWLALLRGYLGAAPGGGPGGVLAGPLGGPQLRPGAGGMIGADVWLPLVGR